MNEKELVPLIDTDIFRFRCGFAADSQVAREAKVYDPEATPEKIKEMVAEADYLDMALKNVKTVFEALTDRFSEEYRAYIHKEGNFRYDVATLKPYKGNRDKSHKPKYFKEISQYIVDRWKAVEVVGIESDDAIGIDQSQSEWGTTVICSNDKDMKQIAGWHYNWVKGELELVSPEDADLMFWWQLMVGDTSDNIPGIKGIGEKKAHIVLSENHNRVDLIRPVVEQLYKKQYGEKWQDYMREVGSLLYIHRHPDDLEKGCPLL